MHEFQPIYIYILIYENGESSGPKFGDCGNVTSATSTGNMVST